MGVDLHSDEVPNKVGKIVAKCFVCGDVGEQAKVCKSEKYTNGEYVCEKHYGQFRRHGKALDVTPSIKIEKPSCEICGSKHKVTYAERKIYLCGSHYSKLKTYGDVNKRVKTDPNEIVKYEDFFEIILYDSLGEEKARAKISNDKADKVKNSKIVWYFTGRYVANSKNGIFLHRFLTDAKDNEVVDHIDGDGLNNINENLRICSHQNNIRNSRLSKNNTSGVTGISWSKSRGKWESQIMIDKRTKHLGRYVDINDAIKARLKAEIKYFGEFSPQQHLFEEYGIEVD